jgi:hypothetical protein
MLIIQNKFFTSTGNALVTIFTLIGVRCVVAARYFLAMNSTLYLLHSKIQDLRSHIPVVSS